MSFLFLKCKWFVEPLFKLKRLFMFWYKQKIALITFVVKVIIFWKLLLFSFQMHHGTQFRTNRNIVPNQKIHIFGHNLQSFSCYFLKRIHFGHFGGGFLDIFVACFCMFLQHFFIFLPVPYSPPCLMQKYWSTFWKAFQTENIF